MTKNEFKIGDRVRIKAHPSVNPDYVGRICEVASVNEGAYIAFKDCDSYWNSEVLELVESPDRKTAFLTELRELMRKYNAEISYWEGDCELHIDLGNGNTFDRISCPFEYPDFFEDEDDYVGYLDITADNIMDFDKE